MTMLFSNRAISNALSSHLISSITVDYGGRLILIANHRRKLNIEDREGRERWRYYIAICQTIYIYIYEYVINTARRTIQNIPVCASHFPPALSPSIISLSRVPRASSLFARFNRLRLIRAKIECASRHPSKSVVTRVTLARDGNLLLSGASLISFPTRKRD